MLALASAAHLVILIVRAPAVAEPDAPSRARVRDDPSAAPIRRSSGAARSPAAACCRSLLLVGLARLTPLVVCPTAAVLALAGGAAWEYIWVEADSRCRLS